MIVVTKEPGKDPNVTTITNDLEGIQKAVGGFFEVVRFWDNIVLVCNDNGKFEGLPYNFTFYGDRIVGPVFFCGETLGEDGGEFCDLTEEQILFLLEVFL